MSAHATVSVLTLLSRAYCHLCDEMREAAEPFAARHGASLVEVDVDAHPHLEAEFGERVPLLMLGPPTDRVVLCQYRFDAEAAEAALRRPSA